MTIDPFQHVLIVTWLGLAGAGLYLAVNAPAQLDPPEQASVEVSP